jgi:hypothetical protein
MKAPKKAAKKTALQQASVIAQGPEVRKSSIHTIQDLFADVLNK